LETFSVSRSFSPSLYVSKTIIQFTGMAFAVGSVSLKQGRRQGVIYHQNTRHTYSIVNIVDILVTQQWTQHGTVMHWLVDWVFVITVSNALYRPTKVYSSGHSAVRVFRYKSVSMAWVDMLSLFIAGW